MARPENAISVTRLPWTPFRAPQAQSEQVSHALRQSHAADIASVTAYCEQRLQGGWSQCFRYLLLVRRNDALFTPAVTWSAWYIATTSSLYGSQGPEHSKPAHNALQSRNSWYLQPFCGRRCHGFLRPRRFPEPPAIPTMPQYWLSITNVFCTFPDAQECGRRCRLAPTPLAVRPAARCPSTAHFPWPARHRTRLAESAPWSTNWRSCAAGRSRRRQSGRRRASAPLRQALSCWPLSRRVVVDAICHLHFDWNDSDG